MQFVKYYAKFLVYYNLYIENHSTTMRKNANNDFDDNIQINRRVLNEVHL